MLSVLAPSNITNFSTTFICLPLRILIVFDICRIYLQELCTLFKSHVYIKRQSILFDSLQSKYCSHSPYVVKTSTVYHTLTNMILVQQHFQLWHSYLLTTSDFFSLNFPKIGMIISDSHQTYLKGKKKTIYLHLMAPITHTPTHTHLFPFQRGHRPQ